jgi:hypothetical protein
MIDVGTEKCRERQRKGESESLDLIVLLVLQTKSVGTALSPLPTRYQPYKTFFNIIQGILKGEVSLYHWPPV